MNGKNREALILEEARQHGITGRRLGEDDEDEEWG